MKMSILVLGIAVLGLTGSAPRAPEAPDVADLDFTIVTAPEAGGAVYVNKIPKGNAPVRYTEKKVNKNGIWVISAEKAGTISYPATNYTYNQLDKMKPRIVTIRLDPDQAFTETVSVEIANNWLTIAPRHTDDQDVVWMKIVSIVTDNFPDVEHMDRSSFYLRTAWRVRDYGLSAIRSRLIVKLGTADPLSIKIQLESQRAVKKAQSSGISAEDYLPYDRVLTKDKETIDFLRDQL